MAQASPARGWSKNLTFTSANVRIFGAWRNSIGPAGAVVWVGVKVRLPHADPNLDGLKSRFALGSPMHPIRHDAD